MTATDLNSNLTVTTFAGLTAKQGKEEHLTWPELVKSLQEDLTYINKEAMPLFKLGAYEGASRARGSPLLHVDALMSDYDAGEVSVTEAARRLQRAGIQAVLYSSASHTPEAPRWRAIAALSTPTLDEATFHAQMAVLNGALGGILATESWDYRRNYFRGRVGGKAYEVEETTGMPLDDLIAFDMAPEPIEPPVKPKAAATAQVLLGGEDPVARYLIAQGLALGQQDDKLFVRCPLADQHAAPQGEADTSAAWLAPTLEHPGGSYACRHTTHGAIGNSLFLRLVGYDNPVDEFEEVSPEDLDLGPVKGEKFRVQTAVEFAGGAAPSWVIKGVLPRAQVVVMYGAPGSGKSFMALDISMAVARGVPWRGRKVKQGRVVYVAAEGAGGFRNRVNGYFQANGLADVPDFNVIAGAPSLLTNDWKAVAGSIGKCDVIYVDTFSSATAGGDENSAKDMTAAIEHCKKLSEATGAVVVLIHHSGKDTSKGSRGHSSLLGACDAEFEVKKEGAAHTLRNSKQKDGEDGGQWGFALRQLVIGMDEDDEEITSCVVIEAEIPIAKVAAKDGDPLGPYAVVVAEVIQDLLADGAPVKREEVRLEVKRRIPGSKHKNFSRALTDVCERCGYVVVDGVISAGEV